ncbi:hypothetical protein HA402_009408 [Bradysia odoriphaga]|nr:hypothetical protein HA402_009408 [Bradysia odoriphaga]
MLSEKYVTLITVFTSLITAVLCGDISSEHNINSSSLCSEDTLSSEYVNVKIENGLDESIEDFFEQAPHKADSWSGVRDTTKYGPYCSQIDPEDLTFYGKEDCLTLNVFTPNLTPDEKLPVIFYIHGGSYSMDGARDQGPAILLDEDVILVTINYRLDVFGFLSLRTAEYPGNMGLKDQLLALKWVNENIHHFGGDRNRITLFGHSAGGSSVNQHILSPASRGLFQRAVSVSGSVLNEWSYNDRNNHTDVVAKVTNQKENASFADVVEYLKNVDAKELLIKLKPVERPPRERGGELFWVPVIEDERWANTFLAKTPERYYREDPSEVDTMFGFAASEYIDKDVNHPEKLEPFNEHFELMLPLAGTNSNSYDSESYQVYKDEIRKFYFGDKPVGKDTLPQYVELLSDSFFVYGIDQSVKAQAKRSTGRTYYYRFSADTGLNYFRQLKNASALGLEGATHVEDLLYLFNTCEWGPESVYDVLESDSAEGRLVRLYRDFILNFVRFGNPTPNDESTVVKPIEGDAINYVDIQNDRLVVGTRPRERFMKFWDEFYQKHPEVFKSRT